MTSTLLWTIDLAREAGARLLDWFGRARAGLKTDGSVVTQADTDVDRFLSEQLRARFPQDAILSEEINPTYAGSARAVWIIDPLDGTTNFKNGLHCWGVSIGRLVNSRLELAVLYFPLLDELYHAVRGQGAFRNKLPISVVRSPALDGTALLVCCSRTVRRYAFDLPAKRRVLGSAAYELSAVARGAAVAGMESTPKVWDLAGGWLLIEEAGGAIETLAGSPPFPLVPGQDYSARNYPVIAAASQGVLGAVRGALRPY